LAQLARAFGAESSSQVKKKKNFYFYFFFVFLPTKRADASIKRNKVARKFSRTSALQLDKSPRKTLRYFTPTASDVVVVRTLPPSLTRSLSPASSSPGKLKKKKSTWTNCEPIASKVINPPADNGVDCAHADDDNLFSYKKKEKKFLPTTDQQQQQQQQQENTWFFTLFKKCPENGLRLSWTVVNLGGQLPKYNNNNKERRRWSNVYGQNVPTIKRRSN
jgi:hypothetical protein